MAPKAANSNRRAAVTAPGEDHPRPASIFGPVGGQDLRPARRPRPNMTRTTQDLALIVRFVACENRAG